MVANGGYGRENVTEWSDVTRPGDTDSRLLQPAFRPIPPQSLTLLTPSLRLPLPILHPLLSVATVP